MINKNINMRKTYIHPLLINKKKIILKMDVGIYNFAF